MAEMALGNSNTEFYITNKEVYNLVEIDGRPFCPTRTSTYTHLT